MRYYKLADALKNKEKTTCLNLSFSYKEVNKLPKEITQLSKLEELSIYYGKLDELPEWIGQLTKLKTLTIQSCQLKKLPKSIGNLKNLTYLSVGYNQLKELPESIGQLNNLTSLNLRSNLLQTLPNSIGNLRNLQTLYLPSNQLKELPESLGELSQLPEFWAASNQLQSLPQSIGQMKSLRRIHLYRNQLQTLPDSIGQLQGLKELNLSYNKIQVIPTSLQHCKSLHRIDMANNQLKELPKELFKLPTLKTLYLNHNKLKAIPEGFQQSKTLIYFSATNNTIAQLPDGGWENMTNLVTLYLSSNKLSQFPKGLEKAPKLSNLYIANNPFVQPPLELFKLPHLKHLGAQGTGLGLAFTDYTASQKILSEFNKQNTSFEHRISTYNVLCTNQEEVDKLSLLHLFEAMRIRYKPLQEKAQQALFKRYKETYKNKPLQKGSEILIWGTVNFKKTEVKERLKAFDIKYGIKVKPKTTHIVVGFNLKKYEGYDREDLVYISDSDLNDFFIQNEEQYLLEESADGSSNTENVAMLLSSTDHQNIDLAFQILKTGGVPQDLITELFLIAKNPKLPKGLRKQAKSYITLHGSDTLKKRIQTHKMIFPGYINENKHTRNIKFYTNDTELDGVKVGQYIYNHTRQGIKFWFEQMDKAQRKEAITSLAQDPKFILKARYFKDKNEIYEYTQVQGLELNSKRLAALPEALFKFKNLKRLNLSRNKLTELPEELAQLRQLQWLNISYNKIATFPEVLDQMPNLKEMIVSSNGFAVRSNKEIDENTYDLKHFPYSLYRK
ncbi:MAG: hypothetical protein GY810_24075 [Aureispira sp.]|nr:hypothetical protein [Aureispira sp.]